MVLDPHVRRQHGFDATNLYGPGDNYHLTHSHVLPALIRRFHEAAQANAPGVDLSGWFRWVTGTDPAGGRPDEHC